MGEFFGRNSENPDYINAIKRGNKPKSKPGYPLNACGNFSNCCGLAATGDETDPAASSSPAPIDPKVKNLQRWGYVKTGLALIGAYVVIKFLYGKFVK